MKLTPHERKELGITKEDEKNSTLSEYMMNEEYEDDECIFGESFDFSEI
ncbi:MAG: hypothetical protein ACYCS1_05450 [Gammaproteobacteria bacterium]